jgi:aminomethyltransferase
MSEFAGYNMPISYSSINEEHECVRNSVGVFDVSHMGEFLISGDGAKDLVQKVTSNNVNVLEPGKAQYSCFTNDNGGIVDDLIVYCLKEDEFLLVINASNINKDWNWTTKHNDLNVKMDNISENISLLAIQGPKTNQALQSLTDIDLDEISFYTFKKGVFAGIEDVIISATGYTGSGGFELYFPNGHAVHIWNTVFDAGKKFDIKPIGLAARDTLRLEMGYCLYGNDIDDETSPLEAGLGWITKLKADNFVGKEKILELKEKGIEKKLVGIEALEKGAIPRKGYDIYSVDGPHIGRVTSGTLSPSLKKPIGLAYIKKAYSEIGTEVLLRIRNKDKKAIISSIPFYKSK